MYKAVIIDSRKYRPEVYLRASINNFGPDGIEEVIAKHFITSIEPGKSSSLFYISSLTNWWTRAYL